MAIWQCKQCGGENPEGTRFCGYCGAAAGAEGRPASETKDVSAALRSFVSTQLADRLIETGGRLAEERRLVTCLFADLSGFTPLADRLDPEQLLEVIDPVIRALTEIVGRYGGYVDKFAGDALLAFFGAPVAHEDDPVRALLVALEMHREVQRVRPSLLFEAQELTLHVGVNSGHVIARVLGTEVRMDYSVLGDAVILAQRLESATPPGETYVGESVQRLTRARFDFEPVGELTLKGKSRPVHAWRLVGERIAVESGSFGAGAVAQLVGRQQELAQVAPLMEALNEGSGGFLSLIAEPGVGKTRLVAEIRERMRASGGRWLQARCISYGTGLPYWPYADLLRRSAGVGPDQKAEEAGAKLQEFVEAEGVPQSFPHFARLLGLPTGGGPTAELEPEAFRRELHRAVAGWLRAMAVRQPVVLGLEDVHWADSASLALTEELLDLTRAHRILMCTTGRPEAEPTVVRLTGEMGPQAGLVLRLGPLGREDVAQLVNGILEGIADEALLDFVCERTGGTPFFVEELIRSLLEAGTLERAGGVWCLRPGWDASAVPVTLEGVLAARIDLLPSGTAATLQVASVIGRQMRLSLLRAVAEDGESTDRSVGELARAGLLDRTAGTQGDDVLAFHHALVQDVAYSRVLRRRRVELHRRVADVAEALYGSGDDVIELLARHLYLGGGGPRAVGALEQAGKRAARLFANDEAIVHFERAVELCRGDEALAGRFPEVL